MDRDGLMFILDLILTITAFSLGLIVGACA